MSNKLEIQIEGCLEKTSKTILGQELKSYNLGKEFNYAVAVLKLLITNSESETKGKVTINLVPKVQYVTPFVTKKLAETYCKELSEQDKIMLLLPVSDGKIVVKDEDIEDAMDKFEYCKKEDTEISEYIYLK